MTSAPDLHTRASRFPLPSIPASVFLILAIIVPLGFGSNMLNADGDPARHLRHGREILETGAIIRVDQFSLLHQGQPYVDMEYGTQIMMALIERMFGLAGVVVFASLLIATAHSLVAWFLLRRGVDALLAYGVALFSALIAQVHWLARPHLVTLALIPVLLDWLDRDRPAPRWWFVLLFLVWANLHAGFLFGLTLMGIYLTGLVIEGLLDPAERPARWRQAGGLLVTMVLSALVTLINAYGPGLHRHAFANLSDPYLTNQTIEFMSPNFHWLGVKFFLVAIVAVIGGFALLRTPVRWPHLLVIGATIASALLYQRNITLFALTGFPLAILYLNRLWVRLPGGTFRLQLARASRAGRTLPWAVGAAVLLFALAGRGGIIGNVEFIPNQFDRQTFPVDIVREARADGLQGRLFNDFRFGGYLQYAWPEQKVFIDGATDVYGADIMRAHGTVLALHRGWRDSLAAWEIDMILVPPREPIANELARDSTWVVWRCDRVAVLLRPATGEAPASGTAQNTCFEE